jgi:putative nucleotidyltransferase with HDIG domain
MDTLTGVTGAKPSPAVDRATFETLVMDGDVETCVAPFDLPAPIPSTTSLSRQAAEPTATERPAADYRMAEVIGALSLAIDIASGQTLAHSQRSAYIAMRLVDALGIEDNVKSDVLYGSLLSDVGCTYTSPKWAYLLQGSELELAKDIYLVDPRDVPQMFKSVWRAVAPGRPLASKLATLGRLILRAPKEVPNSMALRCEKGQEIAGALGFSQGVQDAVLYGFERWDGKGSVYGLKSQLIPLTARIVIAAQIAEAHWERGGIGQAARALSEHAGHWLDPEVANAFVKLAADRAFVADYKSPELMATLLAGEPTSPSYYSTRHQLDEVIEAFATLIDIKSAWTVTHSRGVAAIAQALASHVGCDQDVVESVRRGALLHDLGKLGVPTSVLDKPGSLSAEERKVIQTHPGISEMILSETDVFRPVAQFAGAHHERMDGAGYPRALKGTEIPLGARIVAVADVFQALSVDRPYRPALSVEETLAMMESDAGKHLDPDVIAALRGLL